MAESSTQEVKENAQENQQEVEDWDKTREGGTAENAENETGEYKSLGRSAGRGLAQLMSPHAQRGKELVLTEEEEQRLAAELGKWINTDTNPYEGQEDSYFKEQASASE